jgi:hypothetical protein
LLELGGLARALSAEEHERRIGGDDRALVGCEEVARILGRKDQRSVVLADPSREADDEAADGRVFEEEPELVDDEHAAPVLSLDPRPEGFGEEEVDGRDHLVPQLAHSEDDDRRLEVDVGGRAEHLTEAAGDPAVEDQRGARTVGKAFGDVAENGFGALGVSPAHRSLDGGAFGLVETTADTRAEVDHVSRRGAEPGLVVTVGGFEVENVERMSGA